MGCAKYRLDMELTYQVMAKNKEVSECNLTLGQMIDDSFLF